LMVAAEAAHELLGLGGPKSDRFFDDWLHDGALWLAAGLSLWSVTAMGRTIDTKAERDVRTAWILATLALAAWATGETIWSLGPRGDDAASSVTVSDAFWLAWYPLMAGALVLLARDRLRSFEIHRWMDGVVVMLVTATLWIALFLEPVSEHHSRSVLAEAVQFAYPLGDFVLVGGVLGLYALMGWRPGRMWLVLGLGLGVTGIADASSATATLAAAPGHGVYDVEWVVGALLVAYASWQPPPGRMERVEVSGWRAIALPLAAQALAIGLQIYAYFHEVPRSERLLTVAVLVISMVQIVATRPGRDTTPPDHPAPPADHRQPARSPTSPAS